MSDPLVIGVGNEFRQDDGAGLAVARGLAGRAIDAIESDGEPVGLMQAWADREVVVVVDAVASADPAGTIHRLEVDADGNVAVASHASHGSSHGLGAGEAVALARALDRLPRRLVLIGITGASFELGLGLTTAVREAVEELVDELAALEVVG